MDGNDEKLYNSITFRVDEVKLVDILEIPKDLNEASVRIDGLRARSYEKHVMSKKGYQHSNTTILPQPASYGLKDVVYFFGLEECDEEGVQDYLTSCQALIRCLHNGMAFDMKHYDKSKYKKTMGEIVRLLNEVHSNEQHIYRDALNESLSSVVQKYRWISLLKTYMDKIQPDVRRFVINSPSLFGWYEKKAFTMDQLCSLTREQVINFLDHDILEAIAEGKHTFEEGMNLSFHERELLAQRKL